MVIIMIRSIRSIRSRGERMIDVAATESKGVESELVSERKRGRLFVS